MLRLLLALFTLSIVQVAAGHHDAAGWWPVAM